MSTGLLARARAGDENAFRDLTEPHRRELHAHCYRMLGSLQDAEDALQETLLAAWQGLAGFEERSSLRSWLFRIATRRCLNARRDAGRRPGKAWDVPGFDPPEPSRLGEVSWLEPWPDAAPGPAERAEQRESVTLAFVTALQLLPPRQLAVLTLVDALDFPVPEVADLLGTSVDAAASALKRARARLRSVARHEPPEPAAEAALVARFVTAYETADVPALVGMLTDDAFMSMPPIALEYVGGEAIAAFWERMFAAGRRHRLVPTRANGQPALAAYLRDGPASGLFVLTLSGERISGLVRFEPRVLPFFGLPLS